MHALEAMSQHGAVLFFEDVTPDLELQIVRPDTDEVMVEGGVMDLAQRKAIRNDRITTFVAVGNDMGSVEQFLTAESAHRARILVGAQDSITKGSLM